MTIMRVADTAQPLQKKACSKITPATTESIHSPSKRCTAAVADLKTQAAVGAAGLAAAARARAGHDAVHVALAARVVAHVVVERLAADNDLRAARTEARAQAACAHRNREVSSVGTIQEGSGVVRTATHKGSADGACIMPVEGARVALAHIVLHGLAGAKDAHVAAGEERRRSWLKLVRLRFGTERLQPRCKRRLEVVNSCCGYSARRIEVIWCVVHR